MKKTVSILLILILLISQVLFPLVFRTLQVLVKLEIESQRLNSKIIENSVTLEFENSEYEELNWIEYGKEFQIDSKMYDIISKSIVGNKIILFCINDLKEENLFNLLGKILTNFIFNFSDKNSNNSNNKSNNNSNDYSKKLDLSYFIINIYNFSSLVSSYFFKITDNFNYIDFIKEPPTQPPKYIN